MTSAAATALLAGGNLQGYEVVAPDGTSNTHDQYIDAKIEAAKTGGRLREVRG